MSDSVRPHRRQPTRPRHPWDSPGKNTGVGCHFLLQCMKVKSQSEVAQSCPTLSDPVDCSLPGSSVHGIFQARVLEWGAIAFSRTYVYLRLIHVDVRQKPIRYCKAIISQLKINFKLQLHHQKRQYLNGYETIQQLLLLHQRLQFLWTQTAFNSQ